VPLTPYARFLESLYIYCDCAWCRTYIQLRQSYACTNDPKTRYISQYDYIFDVRYRLDRSQIYDFPIRSRLHRACDTASIYNVHATGILQKRTVKLERTDTRRFDPRRSYYKSPSWGYFYCNFDLACIEAHGWWHRKSWAISNSLPLEGNGCCPMLFGKVHYHKSKNKFFHCQRCFRLQPWNLKLPLGSLKLVPNEPKVFTWCSFSSWNSWFRSVSVDFMRINAKKYKFKVNKVL